MPTNGIPQRAPLSISIEPVEERPYLEIDGVKYEYLDADDHSPVTMHEVNKLWARIVELENLEGGMTKRQGREYDEKIDALIPLIVPDLPTSLLVQPAEGDEPRAHLRRSQKLDVIWDFFTRQQRANPRGYALLLKAMMRHLPDTASLMPSLISAASTAATPTESDG